MRALERSKRRYSQIGDITVAPVVRETDFDTISLSHPRQLTGVHAYVDIVNFRSVVGEGGASCELTRAMHLYGREVTRIVEADFGAVKVHLQGPKLHLVSYRPITGDAAKVVAATLASAAVVRMQGLIHEVLGLDRKWFGAAGVDFGEVLVTKDGVAGDRELLFLGSAANHPAKIIDRGVLLTGTAAELLPNDVSAFLEEDGDDLYRLVVTRDELDELARDHGFTWSRQRSFDRLVKDAEVVSLDAVKIVRATAAIDKDVLVPSNCKSVSGVSLFADVDGFTAYISDAEQKGVLEEAVRGFHVQRSELRDVLVVDFDGLRVQYQGDRMQGLVYQPIGQPEDVAIASIHVAAALISTTEQVLPTVIGDAAKPVAIGLAYGPVVLGKLGERGNRDVVSLGQSTAEAARIQQALPGRNIGVNAALRDLLPEWLHDLFVWDASVRAWVAEGMTADEFERLEASESSSVAKTLLGVGGGSVVGAAVATVAQRLSAPRPQPPEEPLRPWMPD